MAFEESRTSGDVPSQHDSTIYVGNLDARVNEEMVVLIFGQIGSIKRTKFVSEYGIDPYAFVEYTDHSPADYAVMVMNNRLLFDKPMKVNWAVDSVSIKKDTRSDYHIFVGDLEFSVDLACLREAFVVYGEITDVRIVRDGESGRSKGYGFISFKNEMDAEEAIKAMNGRVINGRSIRTNWATKRGTNLGSNGSKKFSCEEVASQSGCYNRTVYVGGLPRGMTELNLWPHFSKFGQIVDIKIFSERHYAFIRYSTHELASVAICEMNGKCVAGSIIKCSWGKEAKPEKH